MQIRLSAEKADPLLLRALQLLQARDNLPHIRTSGKCRAAVMGRPPENDSLIVELVDPFHDELIEQCCGGHAFAGGA